ncbi:MAG: hypothetical protein LBF44_02805, partial [Holosporaceae bacterium]|nr:hypothetical protein [Holosporaceae bacterium]
AEPLFKALRELLTQQSIGLDAEQERKRSALEASVSEEIANYTPINKAAGESSQPSTPRSGRSSSR